MTNQQALINVLRGKCIPYKKETKNKIAEIIAENEKLKDIIHKGEIHND